jgi:erythromycin esterase
MRLARLTLLALALAACGRDALVETTPHTPPAPPTASDRSPAEWLAANAHPISLSMTGDFRDLEPLRAAIGGARVVMLGEQTHGDGTTFLAKARLIAFLHQQMGFDVLAWESGLYDVRGVWRQLLAGQPVLQASRRGIFGVWTRSEQVLPTFDYVASTLGTARPLEMAGFDNQLTGSLARDSLTAHVLAFARRIGSPVAGDPEWPAAAATLAELAATAHFNTKPSAEAQARLLRLLRALRADAAARAPGDRDALFWTQALASVESFGQMMWAAPAGMLRPEDNNPRDAQMAANLVWLANVYYPGRKIIVWAASSHIARETATLRSPRGGFPYATGWSVHMGSGVHRALGSEMYSIGFTAARGTWGTPGSATAVPAVMPGSLEDHFSRTSFANAFVDFRARRSGGDWLRDVYARPFGYQELGGDWTRVLDGMVFTRDMIPSTTATR